VKPRIRIDSPDGLAHNARVFYVDDDGEETDISNAVTGIRVNMNVGDVTTATLDMICVAGNVRAELAEVTVRELRMRKPTWRRRLREATSFLDRERRYV
jgi:hypothetical protein